jgi:hypothetical protein
MVYVCSAAGCIPPRRDPRVRRRLRPYAQPVGAPAHDPRHAHGPAYSVCGQAVAIGATAQVGGVSE